MDRIVTDMESIAARSLAVIRRYWLPLTLLATIALILLLIWPGWAYGWDWTGFGASRSPIRSPKAPYDYYPSKSLWDWLQLLVIPLAVAVVGYWLNRAQQRREQDIAAENRKQDQENARTREQESVLDTYLSQMATLLLHEELGKVDSEKGAAARQVARVQTLTALRRLDGLRKRSVLEFLYDAGLIGYLYSGDPEEPQDQEMRAIIDMSGADLTGASLNGVDLSHAYLRKADLSGSSLRGADLYRVRLEEANLIGADLSDAQLSSARLFWSKLNDADLSDAKLDMADLSFVDFTGANLHGADLRLVALHRAKVTDEQLNSARSVAGARLPDDTRLPKDFSGTLPLQTQKPPSSTSAPPTLPADVTSSPPDPSSTPPSP